MKRNLLAWILRLLAAAIMLQTLYFKFTAAPESVYIFSTIGIEPWGRILTGVMELIASVLILFPRTTGFGALLGLGIMAGALVSHLLVLGISVMNDHGLLFTYALIVFLSCSILLLMYKQQLLSFIPTRLKAV